MSDSGFSNIPPRGSASTPTPQSGSGNERPLDARVIGVPNDLNDVRETVRIRGEVVAQKVDRITRETTVQIRTDRGTIEVQVPRDQPAPREGQRVEIEIQPGRPPQTARVEVVRVEATPVEQRHAAKPETQQARPTATPVNIEVGRTQETAPTPRIERPTNSEGQPLPQTLPEPGTTVRLQPVSAKQVAAIIAQNTPTILATVTAQIPAQVIAEAQNIAAQITSATLTNTVNTPAQNIENAAQTLNTQAITNNFSAAPLIAPQAGIENAASSLPQNTAVSVTPQPTPSAQLINLTPAITTPATAEQTIILQSPSIKQPIDVRIEAVQAPRAELVIPGTQTIAQSTSAVGQTASTSKESLIVQTQPPGVLTGTVIGTTPDNLPLLNIFLPQLSSSQNFALQVPSENITTGTQVQLSAQTNLSATAQTALPIGAAPLTSLLTPGTWPIMEELYQALARTAPPTAQAFSNITPNASAPAQITPAALFFISAMRGGDMSQWLGEKASEILRTAGRGNLLSRLGQESGALNRLSAETVSQDWRAVSIPMFHEGEIQKVALHYRHEYQDGKDEQEQSKHTRFIFDLALDQMGPVQVDGLFRPGRLDVVVRTEETFSQAMQMDMRQTYAKALRQTEVTGELTFQNQPDQWVTIQAESEQSLGVEA